MDYIKRNYIEQIDYRQLKVINREEGDIVITGIEINLNPYSTKKPLCELISKKKIPQNILFKVDIYMTPELANELKTDSKLLGLYSELEIDTTRILNQPYGIPKYHSDTWYDIYTGNEFIPCILLDLDEAAEMMEALAVPKEYKSGKGIRKKEIGVCTFGQYIPYPENDRVQVFGSFNDDEVMELIKKFSI